MKIIISDIFCIKDLPFIKYTNSKQSAFGFLLIKPSNLIDSASKLTSVAEIAWLCLT